MGGAKRHLKGNKNDMSSFMMDLAADTDELLGFNPEADANALLPPVPAGEYFVNLTFTNPDEDVEENGEMKNKRWASGVWGTKNPQKVLYTGLTAELYNTEEGKYDGRQVRDNLVSTMIQPAAGTCRMQGVIQAVTGAFPPSCKTRPQFFALLNETIGEGATAKAYIDWEAAEQLDDDAKDALKAAGKKPFRLQGMKNFPKDEHGNPIPEVMHNGEVHRARNIIVRYITAGGEAQQMEEAPVAPTAKAPVVTPRAATPAAQAAPQAARAPQAPTAPQGPPVPRAAAPQAPRTAVGRAPVPRQ